MSILSNNNDVSILSFMNSVTYGRNPVAVSGKKDINFMQRCVDLFNEIHGPGTVDIVPLEQYDEVGDSGGDFIVVLWRSRDEKEQLTMDDLSIDQKMKDAIMGEKRVEMCINQALFKYARKLAFENEIKFKKVSVRSQYFDASKKRLSVYRQIEDAYNKGERSISFTNDEIGTQTLRVYASNFGVNINEKLRVSVDGNVATLHFYKETRKEAVTKNISDLFNRIVEEFDNKTAIDMFMAVLENKYPKSEIKDDLIMDVDYEDNYDYDEPEERDYEAEANAGRVSPDEINQSYISDIYEKTPQDEDDDF